MQYLADRLHVAWIRQKRFADVECFLESVVFGEKNNQSGYFSSSEFDESAYFLETCSARSSLSILSANSASGLQYRRG